MAARTRDGGTARRPGATALQATITLRLRERPELGGLAAGLADAMLDADGTARLALLAGERAQRLTLRPDTPGACTFVLRGAEGAGFWDDATRAYAAVGADAMPRTAVAPVQSVATKRREERGRVVFDITTEDADGTVLRHELTVATAPALRPFGPAVLRALHCGPACHAGSGFPWEEIAAAGVVVAARTFRKGRRTPLSECTLDDVRVVPVAPADFEPPRGYRPLDALLKKPGVRPPEPPKETMPGGDAGADGAADVASTGFALRSAKLRDPVTPECLASTRLGALTATLHQDALTLAANAANLVAPLLGPTAIAGGTWTIPWLANLAAANAANPAGPGSGVFCLLRQPRALAANGTRTGGGGLLDRLAWQWLTERDAAGRTRTQREAAAGTLAGTLATWGIGAPTDATLDTAGGDLAALSLAERIAVVEGYEAAELGTLRLGGLPAAVGPIAVGSLQLGPIATPPLFEIGVGGIAGTVNFATLGGAAFVPTATIGGAGNVVVTLALPTTTVTATITRSVTWFGGLVLGLGTVAFCASFPFFCPLAVQLAVLAAFVLNNVTSVTLTATGATLTYDVRFAFDPATERVEPFVTAAGRTGSFVVTTAWVTPNVIANAVDAIVAAIGNLFDGWGAALADAGAAALQDGLRGAGVQLPVGGRQFGMRALDGGAFSNAGSVLELFAELRPHDDVATHPFTTQVPPVTTVRAALLREHLTMRRDLNPQPAPPPPGPGPALRVGSPVGLGLTQNVLNAYAYEQWRARRFEATITDPGEVARMVAGAPPVFVRQPQVVRVWAATPPRVEVAVDELERGNRPLVVHFDDVRICFGIRLGGDGPQVGSWELACNFRVPGTVELAFPWVFALRLDGPPRLPGDAEPRTWEFVDLNVPTVMAQVDPMGFARTVLLAASALTSRPGVSARGIVRAQGTRPWGRGLLAQQQELLPTVQARPLPPQRFHLEVLGHRKTLYLLPAFDTLLLELVDGSGAPALNTLLLPLAGAPGPLPTTVAAMTCAQGAALRDFVMPLTPLPLGP